MNEWYGMLITVSSRIDIKSKSLIQSAKKMRTARHRSTFAVFVIITQSSVPIYFLFIEGSGEMFA